MSYRVHHFNIRMTADQYKLEQFLNDLEGEVVAIIPNVMAVPGVHVDFLLIVEKVNGRRDVSRYAEPESRRYDADV